MGYNHFDQLNVYKACRELRQHVSQVARSFPKNEQYKLVDQIIRSSRSVTANIAEGHGRFHYQENIQFCRMARGSLYETLEHINIALDENYVSTEIYEEIKAQTHKCIGLLNGYINYLKRKIPGSSPRDQN